MTPPEASLHTRSAAWIVAALPAVFWVVYSLVNTVWTTPPALGPLTAVNVLYLAMLPAAVMSLLAWRKHDWPGRVAYGVFLVWVVLGLLWYDASSAVEVPKRLLIYGLMGLTAAQVTVGGRRTHAWLAAGWILVAVCLSAWTVGWALKTGFTYRAGVPVNPNLPSLLIGPGLLVGLTFYAGRTSTGRRLAWLGLLLLSLYAILLLGSRGVLLAALAGAGVVIWRARLRLRDATVLLLSASAVVALAQMPSIPHAAWLGALNVTAELKEAMKSRPAPPPPPLMKPAAEPARPPIASASPAPTTSTEAPKPVAAPPPTSTTTPEPPPPPPPPTPAPLDPKAAESTALARFGEGEVASLNLRSALWRACLGYAFSGVRPFLVGGGMGMSQILARRANPVFDSSHNALLQVTVDFGVIGFLLFAWFHWRIVRDLAAADGWFPVAGLALVVYLVVAGLTATLTDMHVYWTGLGAVAGVRLLASREARE